MKVILTEDQVKLVKLIKENTEFSDKVKDAIKDLKDTLNKMYSVLTFTTIAEIRDGETDILVYQQKYETLDDKYNNLRRKVDAFEQRYMDENGDWPNPLMGEIYDDLDMRLYNLSPKVDGLGLLIDTLLPISKVDEYGNGRDGDIHSPFNDITPTNI